MFITKPTQKPIPPGISFSGPATDRRYESGRSLGASPPGPLSIKGGWRGGTVKKLPPGAGPFPIDRRLNQRAIEGTVSCPEMAHNLQPSQGEAREGFSRGVAPGVLADGLAGSRVCGRERSG